MTTPPVPNVGSRLPLVSYRARAKSTLVAVITVADRDDLAVRLDRDGSRTGVVADRRRHDAAAAEARVENPARVVTRDRNGRLRSPRRNELPVGLESKRPCVGEGADRGEHLSP